MAYSTDFKQRALNYIKEGHSHVEASKVFDVGVRTLFTWEKKLREQGHLERKKRVAKSRKIPYLETTGMPTRILLRKRRFKCYHCSKMMVAETSIVKKNRLFAND